MGMIEPTKLRNGSKVIIDGNVYLVVEFQHVTPGNWRGMVRTRLKNFETGKVLERTFRTNEMLEEADVEVANMQFLYKDNDGYHFLNLRSYEEAYLSGDEVGDAAHYLIEQSEVSVSLFKGRAIGIELPKKMDFEIIETYDAVRGNTSTNITKDATIATGYVVQVPLFCKTGDVVRINTETGEYVERVN